MMGIHKLWDNILLVVPAGYKEVGGLYITIDGYIEYLSPYYNIEVVEIPYHENKEWKERFEEIKDILGRVRIKAILTYGLNGSWIVSRNLGKGLEKKVIALIRDSNYFTVVSGYHFDHRINVENVKNFFRLIPYKTKEKYCARNCFSLVYASRWDAKCVKHGYKSVKARIVVQENGVYIPEEYSRRSHRFEEEIVFGFMGSWTSFYVEHCVKPFIDICEKYLIKKYPNIKVKLAGRGITDSHIRVLKQYDYIEFIGEVNTLDEFFSKVDIVFTTVKKKSGILNKVLEAFSFGKCVIGYRDNFYAIKGSKDGINCIMADTGIEFERAVEGIISGDVNIDTIGNNARELIKTHYTWEKKVGIIRNEIERIG